MDKPADPATPFAEVYQSFLNDLALEGTKPSTIHRYRYNIGRFEKWLIDNRHPVTLAALERTTLIAYKQHLETLPQQPRGSIRRRRGGLMSRHTVHSYLRSIKCLASWLKGAGHIDANPFLAVNPYFKKKGVMPVLQADDRIPKIGKPSDVAILLAGCVGDRPEDLRDRALAWLLYSSGIRAADAAELTILAIDFETGVLLIEDGKGDKDRQAFMSPVAAEHVRAYIERGRIPLLERMPRRRGPAPMAAQRASNFLDTDVVFLSSRGRKGEVGLTPSGVLQILTRRYHAGGGTLSSFGPHRLRHGMATYLAEQGVDQREIQRWGGWSNIETVSIYLHMNTTRVRSEQNRVQGPLFDQLAAEARPKVA
jgi:site-specific recombinase XerD